MHSLLVRAWIGGNANIGSSTDCFNDVPLLVVGNGVQILGTPKPTSVSSVVGLPAVRFAEPSAFSEKK